MGLILPGTAVTSRPPIIACVALPARLLSRVSALLLVAAAALVPAPRAGAASVTATAGSVTATFAWQQAPTTPASPPYGSFSALELTIARGGQTAYQQPVTASECGTQCIPFSAFDSSPAPLLAAELDGDAEPEVVLYLYTGGAHCCTITEIFAWDPVAMTYRPLARDWGDPVPRIEQLGGHPVFLAADDRFAYAFQAFAFSGLPVQIFRYAAGRMLDVTRSFPGVVAADAGRWLRAYRANRAGGYGLGFLAAWTADEYLFGRRRAADAMLARENRAGRLGATPGFGPGGSGYIAKLHRFLRRNGYG
jgi:hypothetical protein